MCVCVCLQITLVPKARYENIHLSRACPHSFRAELRAGLREIFSQLDQGRNVAIAGIEDTFFKNALQALFVALGLQQVGSHCIADATCRVRVRVRTRARVRVRTMIRGPTYIYIYIAPYL